MTLALETQRACCSRDSLALWKTIFCKATGNQLLHYPTLKTVDNLAKLPLLWLY